MNALESKEKLWSRVVLFQLRLCSESVVHLVKLSHAGTFKAVPSELIAQPPSCFLLQHLPVSTRWKGFYQQSIWNQKTTQVMPLYRSFYVAPSFAQISARILELPTDPDILACCAVVACSNHKRMSDFLSWFLWFQHEQKSRMTYLDFFWSLTSHMHISVFLQPWEVLGVVWAECSMFLQYVHIQPQKCFYCGNKCKITGLKVNWCILLYRGHFRCTYCSRLYVLELWVSSCGLVASCYVICIIKLSDYSTLFTTLSVECRALTCTEILSECQYSWYSTYI